MEGTRSSEPWGDTFWALTEPTALSVFLMLKCYVISGGFIFLQKVRARIINPTAKTKALKLRGTELMYKMLGGVEKVLVKKDECVIDWLMAELMLTKPRMDRPQLIRELIEASREVDLRGIAAGVSLQTLEFWVRTYTDITLVVFDPFDNLICKVQATCRTSVLLVAKVNNEHIYPIFDSELKNLISRSQKLRLGDFEMKANFDKTISWDINADHLDKVDVATPPSEIEGACVLVDTKDLSYMVSEIAHRTKVLAWNIRTSGPTSKCVVFEHPITNQLIVAAPEWKQRKAVMQKLMLTENYLGFTWKNQTWGEIGKTIFELDYGTFLPSRYPPELMKIYSQSSLAPLVLKLKETKPEGSCATHKPPQTPRNVNNEEPAGFKGDELVRLP